MLPLRYIGYAVVLEEVPDEISLAFNISGCPHRCEGCHSQHLWKYEGILLSKDIESVIDKYKDYISCVCFMGGDQNIEELFQLCLLVKSKYDLKTCIYSGRDISEIDLFRDLVISGYLDYLKIGRYEKDLGGLNKPTTNQKMYQISNCNIEDITHIFWRKENGR